MKLIDLKELCKLYIPKASRHPASIRGPGDWWPAHELGHLLTVPRRTIGKPLFGMDTTTGTWAPDFDRVSAYEIAAMFISERLLVACGRTDLFDEEVANTDPEIKEYGSRSRASQILRRRCPRVSTTRAGLERMCRRAVGR